MESTIDVTIESKKEWTAPELKKIDIDEITAGGTGSIDDGLMGFS